MLTTRSRSIRRARVADTSREQIDRLIQEAVAVGTEYPERTIELCLKNRALLDKTRFRYEAIKNELVLGSALFNAARYAEALTTLQEVLPLCVEFGDRNHLGDCHYLLGLVHKGLADYSSALLHAEESIQQFNDRESVADRAKSEMLLGTVYLAIGLLDKGLAQMFAALDMYRSTESTDGIAKALNNIGNAYNELRDYQRAVEFYEKSLAIKRELGDSKGVANTLNNIAHILFWFNRDYDRALEYYHQSIEICRTRGYRSLFAHALHHIGQVHVYLEKFDDAVRYSLEALEIIEEIGDEHTLAYALMDLGFVYVHLDRADEAIESIRKGLSIAEEIRASGLLSKGYNLLRQIYSENGDYRNATKFCERYIEMQEKLFGEAANRRAQQLTIQFEVEKTRQEKELYRLRTESLRQEMEHKSKELATMAMYLLQKNEFLTRIGRQIESAEPVDDPAAAELLRSLLVQIRETIRSEQQWEHFEQQFKLVHHDFIGRLSELYPALTPMELKVAALLRMNLSTKEIAALLYQSPRSVESYRYRLRRKISIGSDVNLGTFLASV